MATISQKSKSGGIFARTPVLPLLIAMVVILGVGPLSSLVSSRTNSGAAETWQRCVTIDDNVGRLACFDAATGYGPSQPAKGAFAPVAR